MKRAVLGTLVFAIAIGCGQITASVPNDGDAGSSTDASAVDAVSIVGNPDATGAGDPWFAEDPTPVSSSYQINPAHTGATDDPSFDGPLVKAWSIDLPTKVSFPLVARGRIVVTYGGFGVGSPTVEAFDAASGKSLWTVVLGSSTSFFTGITYEAGRIFAAVGDSAVTALDLRDGHTLYRTNLPNEYFTRSPPVARAGIVYVTTTESGAITYAVEAASGNILWNVETDAAGSFAVDDTSACADLVEGQAGCWNPATGAKIWTFAGGYSGTGLTPTLAGGFLYTHFPGDYGKVFNEANGAVSSATFLSDPGPTFHGANAYLLRGGVLHATDAATFTERWYFGDGTLVTAPVVVSGRIYVGASDGTLYGLDEKSGALLMAENVGAAFTSTSQDEQFPEPVFTSIAAAEGYLASPAGKRLVVYHVADTGDGGVLEGGVVTPDASTFDAGPPSFVLEQKLKASNAQTNGLFSIVAISRDGNTLAVGAPGEASDATGVNGDQTNRTMQFAGAVYIFTRQGATWTQQAYLKASNTRGNAYFGRALAIAADGNTVAVGSPDESSDAIGVNGDQSDTSAGGAGAVYIFTRAAGTWSQSSYLKASNTRAGAEFGLAIAMSNDASTLAVGADGETSDAVGINGNESDTSLTKAGAAYVFVNNTGTWSQQAYVKASNTQKNAYFGGGIALSSDGNTMAIGGPEESSASTGINGNQADTSAMFAGAVYTFARVAGTWTQDNYVKASNTRAEAYFGATVALSSDGNTMTVGSYEESSGAIGINGNESDTSAKGSGAVYAFTRSGATWSQIAYLKAANPTTAFGESMAIAGDGNSLLVGAQGDPSNATGINGNGFNSSEPTSGAAYYFVRSGASWAQQAYIKNPSASFVSGEFGVSVALSDEVTLAVGMQNDTMDQGAVYLYH